MPLFSPKQMHSALSLNPCLGRSIPTTRVRSQSAPRSTLRSPSSCRHVQISRERLLICRRTSKSAPSAPTLSRGVVYETKVKLPASGRRSFSEEAWPVSAFTSKLYRFEDSQQSQCAVPRRTAVLLWRIRSLCFRRSTQLLGALQLG